MNGWIGIDLDGTLARYDGWRGVDHVGEPIPAMVERVRGWLERGHPVHGRVEVRIMTARVFGEQGADALPAIERWCLDVFGVVLPVTCTKDYGMIALYDDRCVQVEANTGRLIGAEEG